MLMHILTRECYMYGRVVGVIIICITVIIIVTFVDIDVSESF